MTDRSRTYSRRQLDDIGVPFELGALPEFATELVDDHEGSRRWTEIRRLIFRAPDDGKAYLVRYQQPLTEHQECDTWFDEQQITAYEVEQQPVTVMQWQPVGADGEVAHSPRRVLTELEHSAAWHAIEGAAGEEGADPGTVLAAVLRALDIDPPATSPTP